MKLERIENRYYPFKWWHPCNWWITIKRFFKGFKADHDRVKYGVSYFDCWDLDVYMLQVFKNGLLTYKKDTIGHPAYITEQDWDKILSHMIKLIDIILADEDPAAAEAFDMYRRTCGGDLNAPGDEFLRSEWLRKEGEWQEYKQNCRYEFYDLLKEWGGHLWW